MKRNLIIYGYNENNLGDDLMFAEIVNNSQYNAYFFIGEIKNKFFIEKPIKEIKEGRLLPLRWKRNSDFAIVGGSVMMGKTSDNLKMLKIKFRLLRLNKLFGGRNFIIGANLGPFTDKSEYLNMLSKANTLTDAWLVRDSYSARLLSDVGAENIRLIPDIIMGMDIRKYFYFSPIPQSKSVCISVTNFDKDEKSQINSEDYTNEIISWIEHYVDQGYQIQLLSFEDSIDLAVIDDLILKMKKSVAENISIIKNSKNKVIECISMAELVISTRFHCVVLAALFEKRQIIYSYSDKVRHFAEDYDFKITEVTGEISNKAPTFTQFSSSSIKGANSYLEFLRFEN